MDRKGRAPTTHRRRHRFPRPRGDGPGRTSSIRNAEPTTGFPAHAGMDRKGTCTYAMVPVLWFPRPRGDGPGTYVEHSVSGAGTVSPPTRGWTRLATSSRIGCVELWFPRPRGDGPCFVAAELCYDRRRFPRPRGDGPEAPRRSRLREEIAGFPAHAGMDHCRRRLLRRRPRFPRPRGDGPSPVAGIITLSGVSPPTRGWTVTRPLCPPAALGFPAHAGMDRSNGANGIRSRGFPRPRGDGPLTTSPGFGSAVVSPPTRGWTRLRRDPLLPCLGFPAHAGMDLSRPLSRLTPRWFPRPRGDGPFIQWQDRDPPVVSPPTRGWTQRTDTGRNIDYGFPAHAGMDRLTPARRPVGTGFPRPRGDGPRACLHVGTVARVSPPTRGWTVEGPHAPQSRRGFPAHAGMDRNRLHQRRPRTGRTGFPAHAGMDPRWLHQRSAHRTGMVSPPTRGWTAAMAIECKSRSLEWFPRPRGDGPLLD